MASSEKTVRRAPKRGRSPAGSNDFFKIAGEISDSWIDLGQCDLHIYSLIPRVIWVVGCGELRKVDKNISINCAFE